MPADAPLADELEGSVMLYSSGTTGKPKGVRRPLPRMPAGHPSVLAGVVGLAALFGINENDRYLTPAPLYHAAPIGFTSSMQRIGATAIVMRRFDAEDALRIDPGPEDHRVAVGADPLPPTHCRCPRTSARSTTSRACASRSTPPRPARSR